MMPSMAFSAGQIRPLPVCKAFHARGTLCQRQPPARQCAHSRSQRLNAAAVDFAVDMEEIEAATSESLLLGMNFPTSGTNTVFFNCFIDDSSLYSLGNTSACCGRRERGASNAREEEIQEVQGEQGGTRSS